MAFDIPVTGADCCSTSDIILNTISSDSSKLRVIRKMADDKCWFCQTSARMTRSHALLHYPSAKLRAAREEAWEGKTPGGVRVLLANPRWERRLVKFLELSGVGRVMADGTNEDGAYAARMDEWVAWEAVEEAAPRGEG
jgi:hypothetical protein